VFFPFCVFRRSSSPRGELRNVVPSLLTQAVIICPEPSQLSAQWIHDERDRLSNFSSFDMNWTYAQEVPIRNRRAEVCTEAAILY
jgi:hypothetical protein